jgi:hypothetical protein
LWAISVSILIAALSLREQVHLSACFCCFCSLGYFWDVHLPGPVLRQQVGEAEAEPAGEELAAEVMAEVAAAEVAVVAEGVRAPESSSILPTSRRRIYRDSR